MKDLQKNTILKSVGVLLMLLIMWIVVDGRVKTLLDGNKQTITIGVFSDSYWGVQNGYSYQIIDDAIKIFEDEHPGVKVEYVSGIMKNDYSEWLAEQLLNGTAPDVFFIMKSDFNDFAQLGGLKDLSGFIKSDTDFSEDDFYKSAFESGKYMDTQYALPYECAPRLMFINKTILDQENISMPDKDWTWEDFYNLCKNVTKDTNGDGVIDQFGVVGYSWKDAFYENNVNLFNEDGTQCNLVGDNVEEAIRFVEKLNSLTEGYEVTSKNFNYGKVACMPMLFSEYRAYKSYPLSIKKYSGFEWECVEMPAGAQGDNVSELDTLQVGMNARTNNEGLAWEFMKLLTSDSRIQSEIFDYSEGVSVIKAVTESDDTRMVLERASNDRVNMSTEVLEDVLNNAVVDPTFRNYDSAMEQINQSMQEIMGGNKNISMELIVSNRKINQYLEDIK